MRLTPRKACIRKIDGVIYLYKLHHSDLTEVEEVAVAATRLTIARLAGVSIATVDRVLRSDSAVRPETADRVRSAMDGLRVARASRGRPAKATSFRVALLLPQLASQFLERVERDIALSASFFREHRITPSFYRCDFSSQHETAAFADTLRGYDAAILVALDYPWVERLIEEGPKLAPGDDRRGGPGELARAAR